ncbi:MAG: penicillin acylase family protein, partial [Gammaproteobacteria bacterium]
AGTLAEFQQGLQYFDVSSQNWAYADVDGNIAYWTSGELPLREDLQTLERADGGIPPFLIRDGTQTLRHEWLPLAHPQPGPSPSTSCRRRRCPT